jgi:hypothetical protein
MVLLVSCCGMQLHAQTADELFKQKQTKRKYALLEIAQWRLYAAYLSKGIQIAGKGLTTINEIKHRNFQLNGDFFHNLLNPSHVFRQLAGLDQVKQYPHYITQQKEKLISYMQQHQFSKDEISYISHVMKNLLSECLATLHQLEQLTAKDQLQLSDDERIVRITELKDEMKEQVYYTRKIVNEVKTVRQ